MNNLGTLLSESRGKKPLFMAHMIAGYPTIEDSEKVAEALVKGGADIIELQIPFSDPMADGPAIAVASEEAIKAGATVAKSLSLLKKVAALGKPVAVMTYVNIPFRYGIPKFVKSIADAGASALIVPDCPFDTQEGQTFFDSCKECGVYFVPVVSPGVPKERLEQLASAGGGSSSGGKDSRGFVYCTSRQGITGANSKFAKELFDFVKELKQIFKLPIAVGFGVKSKEDVAELAQVADIVIAGSVFVNAIKNSGIGHVEPLVRTLM
ncbi:MAG: tryptophan synthase subunit alpha [bacterium]|nr:tryptophan synthase subunit alpha [bacterium]